MDEFWDVESDTGLRAVDVYINKPRDKFSKCDGFRIVTVHGLGYKALLNDPRVKRRHFTWRGIIVTYFILLTLAAVQFLI
jgi:hypothetical protein